MFTITEYSKANPGNVLRDSVVEQFAAMSSIVEHLPIDDIAGNSFSYNREAAMPAIAWRGINESYTESTGVLNPQTETLKIMGGDSDCDLQLISQFGEKRRGQELALKVKAAAHAFAVSFIEGNNESNPREIDGLARRLVGSQLVDAGATSGGDALSLYKLDQLLDTVDNPSHLICSKALRTRFTPAARLTTVGGFITWDKDDLGRRVTRYNGIPIVVPFESNKGTDFMGYDEAAPVGGQAQTTSIYCVSFGAEGLYGIQNKPIEVRDLGEVDDAPVKRVRVEWAVGIVLPSAYGAARLRGITNAAFVA